jgi:hypothetical protein
MWTRLCGTALAVAGASGAAAEGYRTENVVIAVMDGTAWRATFGDPEHRYIPRLWNELRPEATLYTRFYNDDVTITKAGHSTIATGTWQKVRNRGPRQTQPTIFDYLADERKIGPEGVSVIFGKGPYAYDPTTSFPAYLGRFRPSAEIGIGESSLQHDSDVFAKVQDAMRKDRPRIVFANFGSTDHLAHSGSWENHVKAIRHQDDLLVRLWQEVQADPHYRDRTTLFVTNDHGYHLDGVHEGFAEHGDSCEGCRHIMLLVIGPDIRKGAVVERPAYQRDIAPIVHPAAEPVRGRDAQFRRPGMWIGGLPGGKLLRRAQLLIAGTDVLCRAIEPRVVVLDKSKQGARRDGDMQVAKVRPIDRRREQILLHIGGPHTAPGPDLERPTMACAALIHHRALHALVESADKESERSPAGVAGAGDPVLVNLGPRFQIIDGAHAVPDTVVRQVLAHEQQHLAGHGVLVGGGGRHLRLVRLRIPIVPALALSDRIVGQDHETGLDHIDVDRLVFRLHAR